MKRLLLDLNVILDVLLDRRPHVDAAARVWAAVEAKLAIGLVPAHGLTTIHCLVARERGPREARRVVETLLGIFQVVPVDEPVLRQALALPFGDFEDAVCSACAVAAGCDALVTRDVSGFRRSPVPVLTPAAAVAAIGPTASDASTESP